MTDPTDRIVFFGTADFSAPSLEKLLAERFNIVAVVTKPDQPVGRGQKLSHPAVKVLANKADIPVLQPEKAKESTLELQKLNPDIGVVVAYGKILPQSLIDLFPKGIINVHASLLPRWRGPSPIEATLLAGDTETGISLMQIVAEMDKGPVYAKMTIAIENDDTRPSLYAKLGAAGAVFLSQKLQAIIKGALTPTAQIDADSTYCKLLSKADGGIDWNLPAAVIARSVRAYLGWPGTYSKLQGQDVIITEAVAIADLPDTNLSIGDIYKTSEKLPAIKCGEGMLQVVHLKPAGKSEMSALDWLSGLRI